MSSLRISMSQQNKFQRISGAYSLLSFRRSQSNSFTEIISPTRPSEKLNLLCYSGQSGRRSGFDWLSTVDEKSLQSIQPTLSPISPQGFRFCNKTRSTKRSTSERLSNLDPLTGNGFPGFEVLQHSDRSAVVTWYFSITNRRQYCWRTPNPNS